MSSMPFGGPWTDAKLEILRRYLDEYTTVLKNQKFSLTYVDAFAGEGTWTPGMGYSSDDYGDFTGLRQGSARIALEVQDKPFDKFVFIENDSSVFRSIQKLKDEFPDRNIEVFNSDANAVLPSFCDKMGNYDRAVVFLDPYATQVAWSTVGAIAHSKKIDCWILFPLSAVTRMMARDNEGARPFARRLDRVFGHREYWQDLYKPSPQLSLFGEQSRLERQQGSEQIADLYRERLKSVFEQVAPTRRVLKNSTESPMFDLFFAASNPAGAKRAVPIADYILKNW